MSRRSAGQGIRSAVSGLSMQRRTCHWCFRLGRCTYCVLTHLVTGTQSVVDNALTKNSLGMAFSVVRDTGGSEGSKHGIERSL